MTNNSMQITIVCEYSLSHCTLEILKQFCKQYNCMRCPGSGSCDDEMQGEWRTSREEQGVDWNPYT